MTRNTKWLHKEIKSAAGPADCVVNLPFFPQKKWVENVEDLTEVKIFRATVLKPFSSNSQTTPASREKGIQRGTVYLRRGDGNESNFKVFESKLRDYETGSVD